MSIKDLEITDQNVQSVYVQSQPDRLTGTAQQNKAVFDAFPQLIRQRFNELLELLTAESGAGEIPVGPIEGVMAETVQQALEAIQQNLTAYINKLKATTGATEVGVSPIGGMAAQNVQKALEELRKAIDDSVSGIIPGGSITAEMLGPDVTGEKIPVSELDQTSITESLSNKANGLVGNAQSLGYTKIADIIENGTYLIFGGPSFLSDYPKKLSKDGLDYGVLRVTNSGSYITYDIIAANASATKIGLAFGFLLEPGIVWERVEDNTSPQVRNLTLQSGFTVNGDCTFFVTQESAVFLAGGVSGTLPANQDTQIGTLPADASPAAQRRRPAETNAGAAYIDIHTDGTVWAHPFAAASQCWFDTSFVAGGGT